MKKKIIAFALAALLLLILCACGHVTVTEGASAQLRFCYLDETIDVRLSKEEAAQLRSIVNGKTLYSDNPSCGFSEDVSFEIDGIVFCPACDTCCIVTESSSGKFFDVSQAERDVIEMIFEAHGGFFPCV